MGAGQGGRIGVSECLAQLGQSTWHRAVIDPAGASFAFDEPGPEQDPQVMTDGRLGKTQRIGQVADAGLLGRLRVDQAENTQATGIGQDAQKRCQPSGRWFVQGSAGEQGSTVEDRQHGRRAGR